MNQSNYPQLKARCPKQVNPKRFTQSNQITCNCKSMYWVARKPLDFIVSILIYSTTTLIAKFLLHSQSFVVKFSTVFPNWNLESEKKSTCTAAKILTIFQNENIEIQQFRFVWLCCGRYILCSCWVQRCDTVGQICHQHFSSDLISVGLCGFQGVGDPPHKTGGSRAQGNKSTAALSLHS